jgi:[ribosomal protein S5]-alanine N-acetyltransferase
MKTLSTGRLIMRALREDDLDAFHAYCRKPLIGPKAGWAPHTSPEESFRILRVMIKDDDVWAITRKPDDVIIGTIGLHARTLDHILSNRREIGYVIDDVHWGQGLVPEAVMAVLAHAFEDLGADEVLCGHEEENTRSKRVIEKCGFTFRNFETRKRHDGKNAVIHLYGMTRHAYEKRHEA